VLDIIKLIVVLTVVTTVAGLAIGFTNTKLAGRIAEQEQETRQSAIGSVFPQGVKIDEVKGGGALPGKYWMAATADGALAGYAFEMAGTGYAGDIKFMAGIAPDGKILGITVLFHNETPGLGSRVNEVPSTKYIWYPMGGSEKSKPWFTEQFVGLSALRPIGVDKIAEWHKLDSTAKDALKEKNTVTAITGSTITTVAFTKAIEHKAKGYLEAIGGVHNISIDTGTDTHAGGSAGGE